MKFSCLLSCYQKESPKYLDECLESIMLQTVQADEIIFIEDGALTEELYNVIEKYEKKLPIIRHKFKTNKGLGFALNFGLNLAKNNLILRMDTDDICYTDRFEKQIEFHLQNPEIDIFGGWAKDINANGEITGERKCVVSHKEIYKTIWANPIIHPAVCFKRDKILAIGSYSIGIKRRQDYELWMRAASKGLIFSNIPDFLIKYRFTENNFKKNGFKNSLDQFKLGVRGLKKLKTGYVSYIYIFMPVIRSVLPVWLNKKLASFIFKFDPKRYK